MATKGVEKTNEFKNSLDNLTKSLSSVNKIFNDFSKTVNSTSNYVGDLATQLNTIDTSMNKVGSTTNKATKNIEKGIKSISFNSIISGVSRIFNTFSNMTQPFVDYVEDLNLLKVAFGDTSDEAYKLTKAIAGVTGYDEASLTRGLGTFRNLTSTLRMTNDQADLLAMNLEKMSLDISSLYNVDLDRAAYALQGVLTGQPRTIKTLTGANVTQQALQNELAAMGIDRKVRSLNQAEKAIVSYLALERQLINSNGDMARTIEQPAQMLKVFRDQLTRTARSIGSLFIPMLQAVIPYLSAILMVISEIIKVITSFFGIDADSFWKEMEKGVSVNTGGFNDLSKSIGGTADAAKKAQLGLRGFDKLNVIKTPTETKTGGSGGGAGLGGLGIDSRLLDQLKEYDLNLGKIKTKATDIRDKIMEWLGFSKLLNADGELIGWKYEGIGKTLGNMWKSFKDLSFWAKTLVGIGVGTFFIGIVNAAKKLIKWLDKKTGLSKILQTVFKDTTDLFNLYKKSNSIEKATKKWHKHHRVLQENSKEIDKVKTTFNYLRSAIEGAVLMLSGLSLLNDSFKSMAQNGANLTNILGAVGGALLTMIGTFVLVQSAVGILNTVFAGLNITLSTGVIGTIGLVVGAFAGLIGWLSGVKEKNQEVTESYKELMETANEELTSKFNQIEATRRQSEELEKYIDSNGRVKKGYEERVKYILNEMNDALGTEYKLVGDRIMQNGEYVNSYKEIEKSLDKYIVKLKGQYALEKYKDVYNKALDKQAEAENTKNYLVKEYNKLMDEINQKEQDGIITAEKADTLRTDAFKKYQKGLSEIEEKYKKNEKVLKNYSDLSYAVSTGNMDDIEKYTNKLLKSQNKVSEDSKKEIESSFNGVRNNINNLRTDLNAPWFNQNSDGGAGVFAKNMATSLVTKFGNPKLTATIDGKVTDLGKCSIKLKADGGFLNAGEMFIAREAGPEMVGRIGNKTAVANNDQIVSAISQGVTNAILSTGGFGGNKPVIIEAKGDANGLMNFITFKQKEQDMQFGN